MSEGTIFLLAFGSFGLIFGLLGVWMLVSARDFRRRALSVTGQVVRLRSRRSRDSGTSYFPTVRFTTLYGQEVEADSSFGGNPPPAQVGQQVRVLYDPADPTQIRIDNAMGGGTLIGGIFTGFGALFLVIGIVAGIAVGL